MKNDQMFNKPLIESLRFNRLKKWTMLFAFLLALPLLHAADSANKLNSEKGQFAQNTKKITGKVVDSDGVTIIGATVVVKGTTNGTVSDQDGNFAIEVPAQGAVLQISFVGMTTVEIEIGTANEYSITLENDFVSLDELVVIGYGTVRKSDVTGAVAKVSSDALKASSTGRIDQALQGKATGVQVSTMSGSPGGDVVIRVRGTGSINNSDPLVVVDGIPGGTLKDLNMSDVESIEVLKDASASAIYGANGSNGVILVTTKKGKAGKFKVQYDFSYGSSKKWKELDLLTGPEWAKNYNQAIINDTKAGKEPNLEFDPEFLDTLPTYAWNDAVYRTGINVNHNLAISGGSDMGNYYFSYSDLSQQGIIKATDYKRRTLRLNVNRYLNDFIEVGANISYTNSERNTVPEYGGDFGTGRTSFLGYVMDPITPFYEDDDSTLNLSAYNNNKPNVIGRTMFQDPEAKNQNLRATPYVSVTFLKDFNFRASYDARMWLTDNSHFRDVYFADQRNHRDQNSYFTEMRKNENQSGQFILNYNKSIDVHSFGGMVAYEVNTFKQNYMKSERFNISDIYLRPDYGSGTDQPDLTPHDSLPDTYVGVAPQVGTESYDSRDNSHNITSLSYLGRINYSYADRYLFTGSLRRDVSNKFGKDFQGDWFKSFSLAWKVHNEDFFDVSFINFLKVRGGWGEVGNSQIPSNKQYPLVGGNIETGYTRVSQGNPNLGWETGVSTNIGFDMYMLDNQLAVSADYFNKVSTNMLVNPDVFKVEGYEEATWVNLGEMSNKGIEISADYRGKVGDLDFSVGGNITFLQNEVTDLGAEDFFYEGGQIKEVGTEYVNRTAVGHPISSFYGRQVIGIYKDSNDIKNYPSVDGYQMGELGNYIYKDLNGDSIINGDDRDFIGSPHPDFIYGINLSASYKGFDFVAYFQGVAGNKIYSVIPWYTEDQISSMKTRNVLDAWTPENPNASLHKMSFDNAANQVSSDRWLYDGDYLRLKNIQLGYTLPQELSRKAKLEVCRVYIGAENLLTFTKYDAGLDPEISIDPAQSWKENGGKRFIGIDEGIYPQPRTFTVGVNLTF